MWGSWKFLQQTSVKNLLWHNCPRTSRSKSNARSYQKALIERSENNNRILGLLCRIKEASATSRPRHFRVEISCSLHYVIHDFWRMGHQPFTEHTLSQLGRGEQYRKKNPRRDLHNNRHRAAPKKSPNWTIHLLSTGTQSQTPLHQNPTMLRVLTSTINQEQTHTTASRFNTRCMTMNKPAGATVLRDTRRGSHLEPSASGPGSSKAPPKRRTRLSSSHSLSLSLTHTRTLTPGFLKFPRP